MDAHHISFGPYTKAITTMVVAIIGAVISVVGTGNQNFGDLDTTAWLEIIVAILGSGFLTWFVQNTAAGPAIKAIQGALTAGFTSLLAAHQDGFISQGEYLTALGAAIVASGFVYQLSNEPSPTA